MDFEPGARAGGKCRLVRPLASGGMGQVWLARNEMTGADLALKVLRRSDGGATDVRFRNEARLAAGLSHRNIVRVFDFIEEPDGTLVLVMELLRGESLWDWVARRGTLSTREALGVVLPVLSALDHAHASGMVHRDVTPANVFLAVEPDGEVLPKLVDFGIAKLPAAGPLTLEGAVLGTPRYMAPEQIRAAADIDGRADLFSVAVVTYEIITGVSPFSAATPAASLAAVLEATVDPDPRIEPLVWIELQRALSKRPYQRHVRAAEMAEALRAAVGESDAALAALLRRDPPSRDARLADSAASPSAGTVDGQSVDAAPRARVRRGIRRAGIAAALATFGVLAVAGLRGRSLEPLATVPNAATPAPAPVEASSAHAPAASTAEAPPPPAAAAEPPPQPSSSAPRARMPLHLRHVRPVATTPGF